VPHRLADLKEPSVEIRKPVFQIPAPSHRSELCSQTPCLDAITPGRELSITKKQTFSDEMERPSAVALIRPTEFDISVGDMGMLSPSTGANPSVLITGVLMFTGVLMYHGNRLKPVRS
jgi:hypothetical protein